MSFLKTTWLEKILPKAKFSSSLSENFESISIDSRQVKKGDFFLALAGENFDGHDFIEEAFENGAAACLISNPNFFESDKNFILVENTLDTLQTIAKEHLASMPCVKAALTGSNGKTTVKEICKKILEDQFGETKVFSSSGNFNSQIGLSLEALKVNENHEIALFEMGMDEPGQISKLCQIVKPEIGLITTIGTAHIGNFHSQEDLANAKGELFDFCQTIIINSENKLCLKQAKKINNKNRSKLFFDSKSYNFKTKLLGQHNILNINAALSLSLELGANLEQALKSVEVFKPFKHRLEQIKLKLNTIQVRIIDDSYNANPDSMAAALKVLSEQQAGIKIAMIGDMGDLGDLTQSAHENIGKLCAELNLNKLFVFGKFAEFYKSGALNTGFNKSNIHLRKIERKDLENLQNHVIILLKASNFARFWEIRENLEKI